MTITILRREPGQTIPRPFNRACSVDEMREMLAYTISRNTTRLPMIDVECLDTEAPVATYGKGPSRVEFFAFTERN